MQMPKIRILCGSPGSVEHDVNPLLEDYLPLVWNIQAGKDGPLVTCILVLAGEVRKQQIASLQPAPWRHP